MDDIRLGARFRALRHRLRWRQADVGTRARLSQDLISLVERGRIDEVSIRALRAHARALDAELVIELRWRAGELDRLMDEGHATLVATVCRLLAEAGWTVQPEVSFSVYGERGSIDVLAWHAGACLLLVVEVKTSLTSVEETLRRHDIKLRLAPGVAKERFGWVTDGVARMLVLPDVSTARRRAARLAAVLDRVYPVRGRAAGAWLRQPFGVRGMLLFLSLTPSGRGGRVPVTSRRVRAPLDGRIGAHSRAGGAGDGDR